MNKCMGCMRFIMGDLCEHPNGFKLSIPVSILETGCEYFIDKEKYKNGYAIKSKRSMSNN